MKLPEGQRFDDARDLFHDHRWRENKPFMGDEQFAELLVVLRPWFEQEFARKRTRVPARKPAKVDKGSEQKARRLVAERSGGLCEICALATAREWHHRKNRSQGGRWEAGNGMHLCRADHAYVTEHPAEAARNGWTVRSFEPCSVPVVRRGKWVRFDDEGGFEPVEKGTAA